MINKVFRHSPSLAPRRPAASQAAGYHAIARPQPHMHWHVIYPKTTVTKKF